MRFCNNFRGDATTGSKRRGMKYLDEAHIMVRLLLHTYSFERFFCICLPGKHTLPFPAGNCKKYSGISSYDTKAVTKNKAN